jgi:hypothetical protein
MSNDCKRRGQRLAPPPVARSASTPSLTTVPATGASARSWSRGGQSHRRAGRQTLAAPLTFSEDRFGGARISAARRRPSRWAPREGGPPAGPLGRGEPPDASSGPRSCRARPPAAGATMTSRRREEETTRTTLICCSSQPRHWRHLHSTTAWAMSPHWRRHQAPPLSTS